jgi:CRISPR-associated protein Cmr4
MFESKAAMFVYCVSPVHMGAGTAIGAIDNPIQRERHTGHPMMAGSGMKGALRNDAEVRWNDPARVARVFGPDPEKGDPSEHAGNLSVSDAQVVLVPVRSLRRSYVYVTSPTALHRLERLLALAGVKASWTIPEVSRDKAVVLHDDLLSGGRLVLESFAFERDGAPKFADVAKWLAEHAVPDQGTPYFRDKVRRDTVLLHDDRFNYFVRNATVVEPHVRISDETGTADEGGLFYTENLPPESLLVSLVCAARERRPKESKGDPLAADKLIEELRETYHGQLVQMGGDSTVGRGQVVLSFASEEVA